MDGHWSAWSGWSSCSPTCGNGYKHRKRECNNPTPKDGGYKCLGDMYEEKTCVGYDCKLQDFGMLLMPVEFMLLKVNGTT